MALVVTLNGVLTTVEGVESGAAMDAVLDALKLQGDRVAVERNGEIVARKRWGDVSVGEGDRLEVVHFVGGGA